MTAASPGPPPPYPLLDLGAVRRMLATDIAQYSKYSAGFLSPNASWMRKLSILLTPPLLCCALYRISHWLFCTGRRRRAAIVARLNFLLHKCSISPGSSIGPGLYIPHTVGLVFHGHGGERLTLYHRAIVCAGSVHVQKDDVYADCPVLGDDVTIGVNAVVSGGVRVGARSYLAAAATLSEDLGPDIILVDTNVKRSVPRAASA